MIPKKIHYCWFGNNPKDDLIKRCMTSWQSVMPDYKIKKWDETNSPLHTSYAKKAYAEELWAYLADYVRLYCLYTEGGIYLDTDVEVLKRFDPLLENRCFAGFQLREENCDWVNNAVLGSVAGHYFLERCMELTLSLFEEHNGFHISPTITTMVLKQMGLREYGRQDIGDVKLLPVEYFYPYSWLEQYRPECITENTYSVHHWAGSWLKKR
jgi:mannosyltransferase OCH1-like enzyme